MDAKSIPLSIALTESFVFFPSVKIVIGMRRVYKLPRFPITVFLSKKRITFTIIIIR